MKTLAIFLMLALAVAGCSDTTANTTRGPDGNYTLDDNVPRDGTKVYGKDFAHEHKDY
ncbi:MAG TPA: hypothetical protein VFA18_12040 [Gemmataceae bacterium]|nr:hypothetical protein [Gemmataceae bacterium]